MEQNQDLDDIFDRFYAPQKPIFKDRDSLRATYIPDSLPHRDKEIRTLANILGPIMAGATPSNAFLYGKPGAGKTAVVKYVLRYLKQKAIEKEVSFHYKVINCRMIDTSYRVYASLCDAIGVEVPITGLPTDEVIKTFSENLEKKGFHFNIVLDEVDFLAKKASKTLYGLTRMNTELQNSRVSLISITNDVNFKEQIDARIRSTLSEQEIVFAPYSQPQLKDILSKRSDIGFEDGVVETSAINRAAAIAASEHGDARRALDLLRVAGEVAENNGEVKVTSDHVGKAREVIETDTVSEVLVSLPIQSKTVLLAIVQLDHEYKHDENRKKKGEDIVTTGDVFDRYNKLCGEVGIDTLTQRRVGDLINELDVLGMINASVVSKGRYGRTRVINLSVQPIEVRKSLRKDPRLDEIIPSEEFYYQNN